MDERRTSGCERDDVVDGQSEARWAGRRQPGHQLACRPRQVWRLWFGRDEFRIDRAVRRIDPVTGKVLAAIDMVVGQQGCVAGSFPRVVWSWCLDVNYATEPARLDFDANTVVPRVDLESGGELLGVSRDFWWFVSEYSEARIDSATGAVASTVTLSDGLSSPLATGKGHDAAWVMVGTTGDEVSARRLLKLTPAQLQSATRP